jgi:hypothetical protein
MNFTLPVSLSFADAASLLVMVGNALLLVQMATILRRPKARVKVQALAYQSRQADKIRHG